MSPSANVGFPECLSPSFSAEFGIGSISEVLSVRNMCKFIKQPSEH